mmetsp:Transcript_26753/g.23617  ORF Transcript_26753/g.23617 Transcript_26753/m.23617 type:complete len:146 (+) Transcript_26753:34-471(+)
MQTDLLIDDTLRIHTINADGKHFDKVSRIHGKTEVYEYEVVLDINTDVYPMTDEVFYKFGITKPFTIGEDDEGDYYAIDSMVTTKFKDYDYVMHGKVFRFELHPDPSIISQYISFGGLILKIKGDIKYLKELEIDSQVFMVLSAK